MSRIFTFSFIIMILFNSCSLIKTVNKTENIDDNQNSNYSVFDYIEKLSPNDYFTLLDSIRNGTSDDLFSLRMAYTKIKYVPATTNYYFEKAQKYFNDKKYSKAIKAIDQHHKTNWVDISSHLYCAKIYEQLGDTIKTKYYYQMYNSLLQSIYNSGDGSIERPYIVISIKEEYELLNWLNLKVTRQSLLEYKGYTIDLLETTETDEFGRNRFYFGLVSY